MKCNLSGCFSIAKRRGLCMNHYRKNLKNGSLERVRFVGMSLEDRLKKFVRLDEKTGCLLWTGSTDSGGYGICRVTKKSIPMRMHRVAWEIKNGPAPKNLIFCHTCDNPPCVNPDHLFLGTNKTNAQDRDSKGRQAKGIFHGMAKLSEEEAIRILLDTRSHTDIADDFGVSRIAVGDIKRGKRWKHLSQRV